MANDIENDETSTTQDEISFEELEQKLNDDLQEQFSDLDLLEEQKDNIQNPDKLGEAVLNVVWEQFQNQIGVQAGKDFIQENRGLNLDLRTSSHIQTTENFANGKIASHNAYIDYQKRYDDWQNNFNKDPNYPYNNKNYRYDIKKQVWEKKDNRSNKWKTVLKNDARADFDNGRPTGSNTNNTQMDHTISAGEIIRDPAANTHLSREEQVAFANSEKNLNLMDSAANQSKGDSTMDEFLNSERNGKKPGERFNIDEDELRKKDKEAREEYEKRKKEGEERSKKTGKKSQREEAKRIGKDVLRTMILQMLTILLKEIIGKLINWLKQKQKSLQSLLDALKEALMNFVHNLKNTLKQVGDGAITTIATAIVGPVIATVKKIWIFLKQGWKSLKEAINYLKDPDNKNKPFSIVVLEVGKIIMAGLAAGGAIALGEVIEKGLLAAAPFFAFQIPLLGSLANIIGIFLGGVVAGIIGALALNLIDKLIAKKQLQEINEKKVEKGNEILATQEELKNVKSQHLNHKKSSAALNIQERHEDAKKYISDTVKKIHENDSDTDFSDILENIENKLKKLDD
ncbi:hypothetical protein [Treponema bryantii]|uniref:hypothetical protein n=1 Tax=Treponema bryantii TaxID=163 RepID=UPI0003B4B393|nr:hypothetical protein [Treponema bryantii]